jgi:hypothetical protein
MNAHRRSPVGTVAPVVADTRVSVAEAAPGVVALVLCIGFSTTSMLPAWSLRFAVLLAVSLVGLVALGRLAVGHDVAAVLAVALAAWALLGGALSDNPRVALLGQLGKEWSLVILIGVLAVWAIGRSMPVGAERLLVLGVILGLGVQGLVGLVQVLVQNEGGELGLQAGRAKGLTANPVYFGALMAGAAGFCAVSALRSRRDRFVPWVAGVGAFAVVTNLSGSRIAVAGAGAVLLGLVALDRSRRGLAVLGAAAAGVVIAELLFRALGSSDTSGAGRSTTLAGDGRRTLWGYGVDAITEQPLFGWGLGRFRAATQGDFSADFVRVSAPNEKTSSWFDAHNIVLEYAIATGIVGCLVFVAFVVFAVRRARGPFLALFLGIAATWMLQPASVSTAPLAFLVLGAAAPRVAAEQRPYWVSVLMRVAAVAGLLVGAYYVVADWRLARAKDAADFSEVESAARWLPRDAVIADLVASAAALELGEGVDEATLIRKSEAVVALEPDRPLWWVQLGARHFLFGDDAAARAALEEAVALEPWHPDAWTLLEDIATRTGDEALAAEAHARYCGVHIDAEGCSDAED